MLTQSRLKELLHYSKKTGLFTWRVPSKNGTKVGATAGCLRKGRKGKSDYIVIRIPQAKLYLAHRLAWLYVTGAWPEDQLDHKSGVGSDNRWRNLRPATNPQNNQNKPCYANSKTQVKGVSLDPRRGTWNVDCQAYGKRTRKSGFTTLEEASKAYQVFAKQHHGEFHYENRRGSD